MVIVDCKDVCSAAADSLLEFSFSRSDVRTYTLSQARQQLAVLLDEAYREGEVQIRRRDGHVFVVRPMIQSRSPLDVPAVSTDITAAEVLTLIREGRDPEMAQEEPALLKGAASRRRKKE